MEAQAVYDLAVRLLAKRARSQMELLERLLAEGSDAENAAHVVQRCLESGWLDDHAFAADCARRRLLRQHLGPEAVRAELHHLAVDDTTARQALDDLLTDHPPVQLASEALHRRFGNACPPAPLTGRAWRRYASFLARRGFDEETIVQVLGPPDPCWNEEDHHEGE